MKCPVCDKDMKKIRWHITYDADEKEFDHTTYQCKTDDVWVTTEIPRDETASQKQRKTSVNF